MCDPRESEIASAAGEMDPGEDAGEADLQVVGGEDAGRDRGRADERPAPEHRAGERGGVVGGAPRRWHVHSLADVTPAPPPR